MDPEQPQASSLLRAFHRLIRCIAWVIGGRPYVHVDLYRCTWCGEVIDDEPYTIEAYLIEPEWWLQLKTCERCGPEDDHYDQYLSEHGMN